MKLPTFLQKKTAASTQPSTAPAMDPSTPTTSTSDLEKPSLDQEKTSPAAGDGTVLHGGEDKTVDETAIQEAAALDKLSDEPEYPKGAKLGIITAALCLSVFLMALVSTFRSSWTGTHNLPLVDPPKGFRPCSLPTFNLPTKLCSCRLD
jgi:hypothetical protein